MCQEVWDVLMGSLYDEEYGHGRPYKNHRLPGVRLHEWVELSRCDWNDIDSQLLDYETIGA